MKDFQDEINTITAKILKEKLPGMIETKVEAMLDDIIDDLFKSYSDTGKAVKEAIANKLKVNLDQYDLIDYNALVAKIINDKLMDNVNMTMAPIGELIDKTVGIINKKEWKLSEMVAMFIKPHEEHDGCFCSSDDMEGEISLHITKEEKHDWWKICIDPEENVTPERCAIEFLISGSTGHIFLFKNQDHFNKSAEISPMRMATLGNIEKAIFRIYSSGATITVDPDMCETHWSKYYD